MAQQTINIGAVANDGTGDTLRDAGDKINDNFNELYAPAVTEQTGVSYTFNIGDGNSVVQFNNGSGITVTVPPNSSVAFEIGTVIEIHQIGVGTVTLSPGAGVTINSRGSLSDTAGQYVSGV